MSAGGSRRGATEMSAGGSKRGALRGTEILAGRSRRVSKRWQEISRQI